MQLRHLSLAGPCLNRLHAGAGLRLRHLQQHILRQADDHRPGTPLHGHMIGPRDYLGNAGGIFNFRHPFGGGAKKGAIIHLLKSTAFAHAPFDLANKQNHRRGIMLGDVHTRRGIGGAGATGDKNNAGTAGEARCCLGHHRRAALLTADRHLNRRIMQSVQHSQIGFTGHTIDMAHALRLQTFHQNLSACLLLTLHHKTPLKQLPELCHGAAVKPSCNRPGTDEILEFNRSTGLPASILVMWA